MAGGGLVWPLPPHLPPALDDEQLDFEAEEFDDEWHFAFTAGTAFENFPQ